MEIKIRVDVEPDDTDIRGSVQCSDNAEEDSKAEQWVIDQLNHGNIYAWAWARVEARCGPFVGHDSLGGISYESREDFERDLLPEMKRNALADLRQHMKGAAKRKEEAIKEEKLAKSMLRKFSSAKLVDEG